MNMKFKLTYTALLVILSIAFTSCESKEEKEAKIAQQEQIRVEREERAEASRLELEAKQEKERIEKEIHDKFINNALNTGATPYAYCFGKNKSCAEYGCSEIKIKTPNNSDVIVTIKRNDKVFRHAYIKSSSQFTFQLPDGVYQTFFYYGKGWNPEKVLTETDCGPLRGGFVSGESFGKDSPQTLNNNILEYHLILQKEGNFKTRPSNVEEAF